MLGDDVSLLVLELSHKKCFGSKRLFYSRDLYSNSGSPRISYADSQICTDFSISAGPALSMAEQVEHAMWLGKLLTSDLGCDCHEGLPHQTREYVGNPIVSHAREFPAGSAQFFETDFNGAFQRVANSEAQVSPRFPSMTVN